MEYKPKVITGKVTGTGWLIDGHKEAKAHKEVRTWQTILYNLR